MVGNKNILKKVLFVIITLGISIPMIQHITQFANQKELWGDVQSNTDATLMSDTWFSGDYQDSTDLFLNDNFGFRSSFVRLHNQIQYSFYNRVQAQGVIIGKDWYLYEYNYIRSYYGLDYVGDSVLKEKTRRLKYIQNKLKLKGKQIIVVLAPGKGSFFPEFFPDTSRHKKSRTNYDGYIELFKSEQINHLDLKNWFLERKNHSEFPLYSKAGIHWSKYGEILALDTLLSSLEVLSGSPFPEVVVDSFVLQSYNDYGDYDIGEGMNLIFRTPTYPMAYPKFHIENSEYNTNKVLVVADSYYWGMFNQGFSDSFFNNGQFWYYNQAVYPESYKTLLLVSALNLIESVESNDVIVLLSTDANLHRFAFEFIDQLYDAYQQKKED